MALAQHVPDEESGPSPPAIPLPLAQSRYDKLYPMTPMDPLAEHTPYPWLVDGLVMKGRINVIFGFEKSGKSRLMAWLLAHMFQAQRCLGRATRKPGRTFYLAGEEPQAEVISRLRRYSELAGLDFGLVNWKAEMMFCEATGMRLEQPAQRAWLRDTLVRGGYSMLVVDPIRRVHGAKEGSNDEMSPILNDLREWSNRLGVTVLMTHHTGKLSLEDDETRIATWSRGATDLPAVLDWALYLRRYKNQKGGMGRAEKVRVFSAGRAQPREPLDLYDHADQKPGWVDG